MDTYGSPPTTAYLPHDLDDIYEYKTDHQYFTYTGNYSKSMEKPSINTDYHRNQFFNRNLVTDPLEDQYTARNTSDELNRYECKQRGRFDNSSFIRSLNDSDGSIQSQSPKEKSSKSTIQCLIKNLGKKAHIWPRKRHESTCNMSADQTPINDPQEHFRSRSKSLDVNFTHKILDDCDATYKIYDRILREGINVLMKRMIL